MQTTTTKAARLKQLRAERVRWRKVVGFVIAASRKEKKFTQTRLGEAIGRSRSWVAKAEVGRRKVENGDLILIAQALGTRVQIIQERILRWNG